LNEAVLQVWKIFRDLVAQKGWMNVSSSWLVRICADRHVSWGTLRVSGMESFLVITCTKDLKFILVSANASVCSVSWDFADASRDLSLLKPTQKRNGNIKKLRRLAARKNIDLWFEDECHFQQHGSRCTMWIPPEDTDPVVFHEPTRKNLAVFGAVCIADGRLVTTQEKKFDAITFHSFLKHLLCYRRDGRKMVVILDNARWHHAKLLKPWLRDKRHILRLDFLPPYSPELNSIERVWKLTRKLCTHNQYFPALEQLLKAVFDQFELWQKPNKTLIRLCAIT